MGRLVRLLLVPSMFVVSLTALLIGPVSQHAAAQASDDAFDQFDKMLQGNFERADVTIAARQQAVRDAIDRAYKGLTKKIEVEWGEDARMPAKYSWTTYSKDMKTRATIDYEAGEIVVEAKVESGESSQATVNASQLLMDIANADQVELNEKDVFLQAVQQEILNSGLKALEPNESVTASPRLTLAELIDPQDLQKISSGEVSPSSSSSTALSQGLTAEAKLETMSPEQLKPQGADVPEASSPVLRNASQSEDRVVIRVPLLADYQMRLIESLLPHLEEYSRKYEVPVSVLLAVIETESSFNPRATSPVPAFGLMQIVPKTAGVDAYHAVYGEKQVVTPEYLYDQLNNILLGSAYLNVLQSRYLRGVKDPQSRFYCAVASYNTGVGNLAATFIGKKHIRSALTKINTMSPDQVYDFLIANLPAEETRNYLKKIVSRQSKYVQFDGVTI